MAEDVSYIVAVSASFTSEPIQATLEFWMPRLHLDANIKFAAFNQVFQSLLDPDSLFASNRKGVNVVLVRWEDLGAARQLSENGRNLIQTLKQSAGRFPAPLLVASCPCSEHFLADDQNASAIRQLDSEIETELAGTTGLYLLPAREVAEWYPVAEIHDPVSDRLGHVPYTAEYFTALGTSIARKAIAIGRLPFKVAVLDLDNTLWQGVAGEDGPARVIVDDHRKALQSFFLKQREQGTLLAICSKNNEEDAVEVFRAHPEMPLQLGHFAATRINWEQKSINLRSLAAELSLGLDSFVFVDDDSKECAEVMADCPEVLALQIPAQPAEILPFLQQVWAFDRLMVTKEDLLRSESYRQERQRATVIRQASTLGEFIAGLGLHVSIQPILPAHVPRAAQLTMRTNQFNTSGTRRTEAEVERFAAEPGAGCLTVDVSDRFGDYGLVGAVFFRLEEDALVVESFLLSCRALGRGVEHEILRHLGGKAREVGRKRVEIEFVPTKKNIPARRFLGATLAEIRPMGGDRVRYSLDSEAACDLAYQPSESEEGVEPAAAAQTVARAAIDYAGIARDFPDIGRIIAAMRMGRATPAAEIAISDPPRNEVERKLAAIWAGALAVPAVGIHDDFFELGGHSLLAVELLVEIIETFNVQDFTLDDILEAPTVAKFAELLAKAVQSPTSARKLYTGVAIGHRERGEPAVLSIGQEGIWMVQQFAPTSPFYNLPIACRLRGRLDVQAVRRAVLAIAARHETLRTVVSVSDGSVAPVIHDAPDVEMAFLDLTAAEDPQTALETYLKAEVRRPFSLSTETPFRAALVHAGVDDYTLLLNLHHIAGDGWSLGVCRREFASYYHAFATGQDPSIPVLPVEYADFASWERRWITDEAAGDDLEYWRRQLSGATHALDLPTDRARPRSLTYRGAVSDVRLSGKLVGQLEALARSEKATLFMVLLAGWYALLRRYSGQEDILVGSPFANRTMPEVGDMVGLFMNVVVLRCDLSGGPTFRELVKRVRVTTLAAFERQAYPFEKLVEILNPTRDASRTPFYQNLFVLQTAAGSPAQIPDLEMEWRDIHTGTAKTDLTMSLEDRDGGLGGWLEYSTDLYDATTIERLMGHYRTLLENAAADPDRAITALEMLSEPERHQILTEWNATETEYPRDVLVPEAFSRQAANSPERVALTFGGSRFTYGELEARSNQVARRLQRMGVGPGALVGVHVERSPEMLVALLGVMKSGAGYVPLDPGFPPDRLNFMVEDAALRALITEESAHTPLAARIGRILIDRDWPAISKESGEGFACPAGPDDVAYVLYTSGSTGKPKGVQITHLALANFQYSMAREPGIKAEDVLLAVTTISFDIAGLELYLPLMIGASLVLTPKEATLDARVLSGLIERYSVTVMQATPATWQMLLDSGWEGNRNMRALCGGEALSRDLANGLLRRVGELWNMYGPTETTIWSLVRRIAPADRTILIGRPIANTTVYILDENQNPVPVGVTGELYIGGEGVSTGYLNRAELTAERFIPDPFKSGAGNIYKTGDLARFWSTGEVECLGRNDFQVKIRGFRIELAEIESVLKEHPAVRQCVVAACEDNRGKRLVAYLVAREGERPLSTDLRAFLAVHLPDYMVPAQFVFIDAIPVTPNGKVDRLALPGPDSTPSASAETGYAPPADDFERLVAESWAEILGVPRVGIHDNFFDLGGHSLLAVQLAVRLEEIIPGEPIPLVAVLEAPTVERMAAWLRNRTTGESRYLVRMRPPRVVRPEAGGVFPPSPLS